MVRTTTGVECESCGLTSGHHESDGNARCGECGRFAEPSNDYCAEHGVNVRKQPVYDECVYCKRDRERQQLQQERQARRSNPRMHPSVDAPRW